MEDKVFEKSQVVHTSDDIFSFLIKHRNSMSYNQSENLTNASSKQKEAIDNSPIVVYYFDFECLPESHEKSQIFDAEKLTLIEPPHVVESLKKSDGRKQGVKDLRMKRTKRAFNVYKCEIDPSCQSFKLKINARDDNTMSQCQECDQTLTSQISITNQIEDSLMFTEDIIKEDDLLVKQHSENGMLRRDLTLGADDKLNQDIEKLATLKFFKRSCSEDDRILQNNNIQSQIQVLIFENPYFECEEFCPSYEDKSLEEEIKSKEKRSLKEKNVLNEENYIKNNANLKEINGNKEQNNQDQNKHNKDGKKVFKRRLAIYNKQLIKIEERKQNQKSVIISTDLGGTLCGIPEATQQFMYHWIKYFWFDKSSKLIYNSGRGIHPFQTLMKREFLVLPDYYIGRCGSYIYLKEYQRGFLYQDKEWLKELEKSWSPDKIKERLNQLSNWLVFKERNEPEVWSLRYTCETSIFYVHQEEFKKIEEELISQGVLFNIIEREKKNFMNIEIVPFITDKGFSLEYLLNKVYFPNYQQYKQSKNENINKQKIQVKQQHEMSQCIDQIYQKVKMIKSKSYQKEDVLINKDIENIVVASFGDTMNDDGMLRLSNYSICVENSEQQLVNWVKKQNHPNLFISEHKNGYALLDFIKKYI